MSRKDQPIAQQQSQAKITPVSELEHDPDEAERWGAFVESALSLEEAAGSADDPVEGELS